MIDDIENLKKRLIYRSQYRGTKEMDILMSGFVKSIISDLNYEELVELNLFVNLDDRELQKIKENNISIENFTQELIIRLAIVECSFSLL